jgi:hypothetical protein
MGIMPFARSWRNSKGKNHCFCDLWGKRILWMRMEIHWKYVPATSQNWIRWFLKQTLLKNYTESPISALETIWTWFICINLASIEDDSLNFWLFLHVWVALQNSKQAYRFLLSSGVQSSRDQIGQVGSEWHCVDSLVESVSKEHWVVGGGPEPIHKKCSQMSSKFALTARTNLDPSRLRIAEVIRKQIWEMICAFKYSFVFVNAYSDWLVQHLDARQSPPRNLSRPLDWRNPGKKKVSSIGEKKNRSMAFGGAQKVYLN